MTLPRVALQMLQMSAVQDDALTGYHSISAHVQGGTSIFYNVIAVGQQWRGFALHFNSLSCCGNRPDIYFYFLYC
jgi:hypothetical protein